MDTEKLPKTRAEAKAAGAAHYFTGEPCKHGHIAPRKTKGACVECMKAEWVAARETRADYFKTYNASDAGKAAKERYYAENREQVIARAQARPVEDKRRYRTKYKNEKPDMIRAIVSNRRRRHRSATPAWLTKEQRGAMRALYMQAVQMSRTTGEKYTVDHIVPLQGERVCGLHVPWNLRVIPHAENSSKSNKHVDE